MKAKGKVNKKKEGALTLLRREAELILSAQKGKTTLKSSRSTIRELIRELQVYQVELEMQNEELRVTQGFFEEEKQRLSSLFNLAPFGYFILNRSGIIEDCNDTGLEMVQIVKSKLIGKSFNYLVLPEDSATFYGLIRRLLATKSRIGCQLKMRSNHEHEFYAQVEGKYITDLNLKETYFYFAVIDITEKRLNELRQRETQEQLNMALSASLTGTWNMDLKAEKINLDAHAIAIMGFGEMEFVNTYEAIINIIHEDDKEGVKISVAKAIDNNWDLDIVFRIRISYTNIRYIEVRGHMSKIQGDTKHFAGILTDITEKTRLEWEASQFKENQQKKIIKAIVETTEKECARISSSLHDSVGQLLYAVNLQLESCKANDASVKKAQNLVSEAIKETRNIAFELAPSVLTDFGLPVALKEMMKRLDTANLHFSLQISGLPARMPGNIEIFIFRIVQELVNNIMKHAKATHGGITLFKRKKEITIKVSDNGIGFDNEEPDMSSSGLYSIKNRLALYNGTMQIDSKKNKGTTVTVKINDSA